MKSLLMFVAVMSCGARAFASEPVPPLTLSLVGPAVVVPGQEIEVELEIHRRRLDRVPMHITFSVPAGVALIGQKQRETIVDDTSTVIQRKVRLSVIDAPKEVLRIAVDQRTRARGVHAIAEYRFGRPVPSAPPPRVDPMRGPGGGVIARPVRGIEAGAGERTKPPKRGRPGR